MRRTWQSAALLTMILMTTTAGAELYRWTDESGRVHFSDRAPVGRDADALEAKEPPRIGQGTETHQIHQRLERLRDAEAQQQREQQARLEEERRLADERREQCTRMRKYLANYVGRIYDMENDAFLTDAQIEADRQRMQQWLNENCRD